MDSAFVGLHQGPAALRALVGAALAVVAGAARKGVAAGPLPVVAEANWSLRFHAGDLNCFGELGVWRAEPRAAGQAALRLVPQSPALPSAVHESLACVDSREHFERQVRPYVTNAFRRADFAARPPGSCGAAARCGRTVVDGAFDEEELEELSRVGPERWGGLAALRELLAARMGVPAGGLAASGGQLDDNVQADVPCQMHVDFQSRPQQYFYTAIVYLADQREESGTAATKEQRTRRASGRRAGTQEGPRCTSCETVFVDEVDAATGLATRGLAVEPRRGRVLLFSGGPENLHCKLPSRGDRRVAQIFFRCGGA